MVLVVVVGTSTVGATVGGELLTSGGGVLLVRAVVAWLWSFRALFSSINSQRASVSVLRIS
jgi:hypothetical protein